MKNRLFNGVKSKILLISSLVFIIALSLFLTPALAKNPKNIDNQALPETDGTYDVPGHANLKLRVIVHNAKPVKPAPTQPPPVEVCGKFDTDSSAVVKKAGWRMPSTWTYRLNSASVPASVKGSLATIAENAFAEWTSAVPGKVTLSQGTDTTMARAVRDGQNIITWGRASGSALGITYIWYDTVNGYVAELDTIMNLKFPWAWSDPSKWATKEGYIAGTTCAYQGVYDAQDIMTHELGHWFGLNDVYETYNYFNTMYGYGSTGETKADTLTTGDKEGVRAIYN